MISRSLDPGCVGTSKPSKAIHGKLLLLCVLD
jgi:hypothetical protein